MRGWLAVSCSLLWVALDVSVTTVLYLHGTEYQRFSADLLHFSVSRSFLDLWAACVLRLCLLSGAGLGVCLNPAQGPERLGRWANWLLLLCGLVPLYATVKLLLYSDTSAFPHDPWFWGLLAWTYLSSLATYVALKRSCANPSSPGARFGTSDEEQSLLSDEERGQTSNKVTAGHVVWRLLAFCKHDACVLASAFVFLLICVLSEIFIPFFLGQVLDAIIIQKSMTAFTRALFVMALLSLISGITGGFREGLFNLAFARLNIRIRKLLLTSLLQQEIAFFDCNHTGDITSRLTSDTTVVSDIISQNANTFLRSLVKTLGVCIIMVTISWKLSLVTMMGFPMLILVSDIYSQHYKALAKEVQDALAKANHIAEEAISCIKTVRSFAAEEVEGRVYHKHLSRMYALNKREALASACFSWVSKFMQLAVQCSIIYYGGFLVLSNNLTSGRLISFIIYELALGDCLQVLGTVLTGLIQAVGVTEKVLEIIDRTPAMPQDGTLAPETLKGEVTFRNVTFSYPSRPDVPVLNDMCFTLSPGKVTALVGPSGSGKSSCVHLIERFYSPQAGEVLLDGVPLSQYQPQYLHSQIALVGQEPVLFARSIEENITYGMEEDSFAGSVTEAAKKANAHDFITEMKEGYSTETGEKGAQLSGGQKQRVAIARALVRTPRVLLLDEATSALDAESDHKVQEALYRVKENCTVLIIAHRLSTVEKVDNIIVIDKGSVVEQGSHKELMRKGGLYFMLVQWQTLDSENSPEDKLPPSVNHLRRNNTRETEEEKDDDVMKS